MKEESRFGPGKMAKDAHQGLVPRRDGDPQILLHRATPDRY